MKRIKQGTCVLAAILFLLGYSSTGLAAPPADLTKYDVYSKYDFGSGSDTLRIGVQPLYSSTGHLIETMRRDLVLKEALENLGLKVRFFPFLKGRDLNFFVEEGGLDGGVGGDMPTITLASKKPIVVASVMQRGYTSLVARELCMVRDLKGKKIGFAFGSNAHYALLDSLASDGVDPSEVRMISLEVSDMEEALSRGKIDAFSAWEPTPSITIAHHPDYEIVHRHINTGYLYVTKEAYDKNPEAVRLLVAAELRAVRWLRAKRENLLRASHWAIEAAESFTQTPLGLSDEQMADMAMKDFLGEMSLPEIPTNSLPEGGNLYREFVFLKKLGKIEESVAWDTVQHSFEQSIIDKILEESKRYRLDYFLYEKEEKK